MTYAKLKFGGKTLQVNKTNWIAYQLKEGAEETMPEVFSFKETKRVGDYLLQKSNTEIRETELNLLRRQSEIVMGTHTFTFNGETTPRIPTGDIFLRIKTSVQVPPESIAQSIAHLFSLTVTKQRSNHDYILRTQVASRNPVKVCQLIQEAHSNLVEVCEFDSIVETYTEPIPPLISPKEFTPPQQKPPTPNPQLVTRNPQPPTPNPQPETPNPQPAHRQGKYVAEQWHMENTGIAKGEYHKPQYNHLFTKGADVSGLAALDWLQEQVEEGKINLHTETPIAIIDDGCSMNHPYLNVVSSYNDRTQSTDVNPRPGLDQHGTACAGVAAGKGEIAGIAYGAKIDFTAFSYVGDIYMERIFGRIEKMNIAVVSCSWGVFDLHYQLSTRQQEALRKCHQNGRGGKGTVICFAAANNGYDYGDNGFPSFAGNEYTLAIGSTGSRDELSTYSNTGKGLFCVASSSIMPIVTANVPYYYTDTKDGKTKWSGYNPLSLRDPNAEEDTFVTGGFGGTSSATPLVAGLIHACHQIHPDLTAAELTLIIRRTCQPLPELPQAESYPNNSYGYGRINALAAVQLTYSIYLKDTAGEGETGGGEETPKSKYAVSYLSGMRPQSTIAGEIKSPEYGNVHICNFITEGSYYIALLDRNGKAEPNPDLDMYVRRIGEMGMSVEEAAQNKDLFPSEIEGQYDFKGISTQANHEVLHLNDIPAGTYAFLVVVKSGLGKYSLILRRK